MYICILDGVISQTKDDFIKEFNQFILIISSFRNSKLILQAILLCKNRT